MAAALAVVLIVLAFHVTFLALSRNLGSARAVLFSIICLVVTCGVTYLRYRVSIVDSASDEWTSDTYRYLLYGSALEIDPATALRSLLLEDGTSGVITISSVLLRILGGSWFAVFLAGSLFGYIGAIFLVKAIFCVRPDANVFYAYAVVLYPSVLYWSSSFGKEAFSLFAIGLATFSIARATAKTSSTRSSTDHLKPKSAGITFLLSVFISWAVRPQVSVLIIVATVAAYLLFSNLKSRVRALSVGAMICGILGAFVLWRAGVISDSFGIFEDMTTRLDRTSIGDAQIGSGRREGLAGLLVGIFTALTRPFPWEGGIGGLGSSLDIPLMFIAVVQIWKAKRKFANASTNAARTIIFSLIIIAVLFVPLASYGNLGLLVRMRSLIIGPLIVVLAILPALKMQDKSSKTVEAAKRVND